MWSVSPRFSWTTSTPPRALAAFAHAPISLRPPGPRNVIGVVASEVAAVAELCRTAGARPARA